MSTAQTSGLILLPPFHPKTSTYFGSHLFTQPSIQPVSFFLRSPIIPIECCFSSRTGLFVLSPFPTTYHRLKSKLLAALQLTYLATPPSCFQFRLRRGGSSSVCSGVRAAILPEVRDKFLCICSQSGCALISFWLTIHLRL